MTLREERLAENESFFRAVNERIDQVVAASENGLTRFVCECGDANCDERITMTQSEYEGIRSESTTFAVFPGHVIPDIETVLTENERFTVVQKRGEAGNVADENDPRS